MSADDTGDAPPTAVPSLTFNIKSSADDKYVVTVPENITVLDLKQKLSTSEYADVPADRQRLIYSGRVLKDPDPLSTYKIKDGNTIHMVKSAASNAMRNPAASPSSGGTQPGTTGSANPNTLPQAANVPQNIASGTGHDPLAGLTGARYAGFAPMPGANTFGPDGGMGMNPPSGDEMLRMLENPMFAQQMNEAMNNPMAIRMMQEHPMIRNNPMMRRMLENPEFRRMLMDPEFIRMSMQQMGGAGGGMFGGGNDAMPAPGATDNTGSVEGGAQGIGQGTNADNANNANNTSQPPPNPFSMLNQPGLRGGAANANAQNPFASLFGGMPQFNAQANNSSPGQLASSNTGSTGAATTTGTTSNDASNQAPQEPQPQQPNPFAGLFGMPAQPSDQNQSGNPSQSNPLAQMTQQLMQNPELMRSMMASMGFGGNDAFNAASNDNQAPGSFPNQNQNQNYNSLADLFAMAGAGGGGGFGGANWGAPAPPQDTRPPEEQYAEQLRQLNEMGFNEFEANIRALRRSGGSVQGAIEALLNP